MGWKLVSEGLQGKDEGLSLNHEHPHEKPGVAVLTCNHSIGK